MAERGLEARYDVGQVLNLVANAERMEKESNPVGAVEQFRKALALDAEAPRAADGIARIEARFAADAFAGTMARGYSALAKADYASARSAFEAARRVRPNAPEIPQALRQIEQEQRTGVISAKLGVAQEHEGQERWADALKEYRAVVELDSTVAAAQEGIARVSPRAALNEQLDLYLTQPERLFSQPVRAAARDTLARASSIASPGPVLQKQVTTLKDWVARADVPVPVALQSDNLTRVTIYRVGELGTFAERSLDLVPGSYTLVGTRPGYPRRTARDQRAARLGAAARRDPLRGSHLSGLVVRESLGERRFAAADFPIAVGGAGAVIVMAGRPPGARSVHRPARRPVVRATRGRRRSPAQRHARAELDVAA